MEIKPYFKNAKKHPDKQLTAIAKSIKEFGWQQSIVVDTEGVIIVGHGRWLAYQKYKDRYSLPEPEIKVAENLSNDQVKAYRLADNKLNESDWEMDFALEDLKDLPEDLFDLTGFDSDLLIEDDAKDDIIPESSPVIAKLGDIFQLGNHRIMCGDSTKLEDVQKLMGEIRADIVFTDPPYGINIVHNNNTGITVKTGFGKVGTKGLVPAGKYSEMLGDDKPFDPKFLLKLADKIILWGANNYASKLLDNAHWLVWDKKAEKGADHNNFSDCELIWTNIKQKSVRIYRYLWSGLLREGNRKEELKKRIHPTQKPVGLLVDIIQDYTKENNLILDLFLGSGSMLIACEKSGRKCYGMELEPKYIDLVITRWENFTNQKAIKL